MVDSVHACIEHNIFICFLEFFRNLPCIPDFTGRIGAVVRLRSKTIRIPDLVFGSSKEIGGEYEFDCSLSPLHAPKLVVEVTSRNPKNDYVKKMKDYASAEIKYYWIVDRKEIVVKVYQLQGSRYGQATTYKSSQSISSEYFGTISVQQIFQPPSPTKETQRIGFQDRARLQREVKNRENAEHLAGEAKKHANEEKCRAARLAKRVLELEKILEVASSSSPPKKIQRRRGN